MKNWIRYSIRVGLFLLLTGTIVAQTIVTNPAPDCWPNPYAGTTPVPNRCQSDYRYSEVGGCTADEYANCTNDAALHAWASLFWNCSVPGAGTCFGDWGATGSLGFAEAWTDLIIFGSDVSDTFDKRWCNVTCQYVDDFADC